MTDRVQRGGRTRARTGFNGTAEIVAGIELTVGGGVDAASSGRVECHLGDDAVGRAGSRRAIDRGVVAAKRYHRAVEGASNLAITRSSSDIHRERLIAGDSHSRNRRNGHLLDHCGARRRAELVEILRSRIGVDGAVAHLTHDEVAARELRGQGIDVEIDRLRDRTGVVCGCNRDRIDNDRVGRYRRTAQDTSRRQRDTGGKGAGRDCEAREVGSRKRIGVRQGGSERHAGRAE